MSKAQRNMEIALKAMEWATSRIPVQSNQIVDRIVTQGDVRGCVLDMRADHSESQNKLLRTYMPQYNGMKEEEIRKKSERDFWIRRYIFLQYQMKKAIQYSCGNCGELTSATLLNLIYHYKYARPVEYMHHIGGDHAFVVIGRKGNSTAADPSTWGAAAVICDPWKKAVFPASGFWSRLQSLWEGLTAPNQRIGSWYRVEGAGPLPDGI